MYQAILRKLEPFQESILFFLPEHLMDYVVVHELAHRIHMNHSKDFWKVVATYCPEYKKCTQELKHIYLVED